MALTVAEVLPVKLDEHVAVGYMLVNDTDQEVSETTRVELLARDGSAVFDPVVRTHTIPGRHREFYMETFFIGGPNGTQYRGRVTTELADGTEYSVNESDHATLEELRGAAYKGALTFLAWGFGLGYLVKRYLL